MQRGWRRLLRWLAAAGERLLMPVGTDPE